MSSATSPTFRKPSVIRSSDELREKAFRLLELLSSLILFGAGIYVSLLPGLADYWKWLAPLAGLFLAVSLPAFVYGEPVYKLVWTFEGLKTEGAAYLDLARLPEIDGTKEAVFSVDLFVECYSLWAFRRIKKAIDDKSEIEVASVTAGALTIKRHNQQGGARIVTRDVDGEVVTSIRLPIKHRSNAGQQSRLLGAMIPHVIVSALEEVPLRASFMSNPSTLVAKFSVPERTRGITKVVVRR